jgi:hypothetical protein
MGQSFRRWLGDKGLMCVPGRYPCLDMAGASVKAPLPAYSAFMLG